MCIQRTARSGLFLVIRLQALIFGCVLRKADLNSNAGPTGRLNRFYFSNEAGRYGLEFSGNRCGKTSQTRTAQRSSSSFQKGCFCREPCVFSHSANLQGLVSLWNVTATPRVPFLPKWVRPKNLPRPLYQAGRHHAYFSQSLRGGGSTFIELCANTGLVQQK